MSRWKYTLVTVFTLALLIIAGTLPGMLRELQRVDPEEDALKKLGDAKAGDLKSVYSNLEECSDLIKKLPEARAGKIPAFDSYWTPWQVVGRLGRHLTPDESESVRTLNTLPYRVKTFSSFVGLSQASISASCIVYGVTGSFGTGYVTTARMDRAAEPSVKLLPSTVRPRKQR